MSSHISIVSHIYPTKHDPSSGIFIQKEARLINESHSITVLVPGVYAFPFQKQFKKTHNLVDEKFNIDSFRYLSIPRKKLPLFSAQNLSRGLYGNLKNRTQVLFMFIGCYLLG